MKIAIVSDIHGNLEALNAVLEDILSLGVETIYCLGDTVGYGPYPGECLDIIRKKASLVLKGNHEEGLLDFEAQKKQMSRIAQVGILFSIAKLTDEQKLYVAQLPTIVSGNGVHMAFSHGAFSEHGKYIHNQDEAEEELQHLPMSMSFIGHTHVPFVFGSKDKLFENLPDNLELDSGQIFLMNVGSVGQPRDGDCRACYAVVEENGGKFFFNLRRVFYDIGKTEKAIHEFGLPHYLSERLFRGE